MCVVSCFFHSFYLKLCPYIAYIKPKPFFFTFSVWKTWKVNVKTLTWVISILLLCLNIFKLCKIRYSTFSICTCIFYYIAVSPNCSIVPRIPRVKDIDLERTYKEPRPTGCVETGKAEMDAEPRLVWVIVNTMKNIYSESLVYIDRSQSACVHLISSCWGFISLLSWKK